ncbi:PREDICTED: uncharacterized protein LOC108381194 [Rhagoletis zephyria]|uniref:uncharacterized protein LOC108381194 n=1 Tax=Rhagoletis zephyria TaxID=28612 RepID=UPI00081161F9|nr:PREDICTED: uncharacterized protein LOC108381194 [Rhagoletis zephyria]
MQLFYNLTAILNLIGVSPMHQQFGGEIRTFLYTRSENPSKDHLNVPDILQELRPQKLFAVINIDVFTPIQRYRDLFKHNFLSIVQLSQNAKRDKHLISTLLERLHWSRNKPIILLLDDTASEAYVDKLFEFSARKGGTNVIALQPQMAVGEREYWKLITFPVRQTNMHGQPMRLMERLWYPKTYNYTPAVRGALKNGSADVGLISRIEVGDIKLSSTTVVHRTDWCLMVPVENPLPPLAFFNQIMDTYVNYMPCFSLILISYVLAVVSRWKDQRQPLFIEYFINISVLQGLLGMTFWLKRQLSRSQKYICITISFAGIIFGTAYNAYLQSFTVNAPLEPEMKTIEDVLNRGIKIAVSASDICWISHYTNMSMYIKNFTIFTNYTEMLLLRDSFDTRYAFLAPDMWPIYNEQQKYFSKPIFRISDICFEKDTPLVLPLPVNSVYRETLNKLFLTLQEAGLMNFWQRHSFVELTAMKVIKLEDSNKKPGFESLKLEDLRVIFIGMCILMSLSIFVFVLELCWEKLRKFGRSTVSAIKLI